MAFKSADTVMKWVVKRGLTANRKRIDGFEGIGTVNVEIRQGHVAQLYVPSGSSVAHHLRKS